MHQLWSGQGEGIHSPLPVIERLQTVIRSDSGENESCPVKDRKNDFSRMSSWHCFTQSLILTSIHIDLGLGERWRYQHFTKMTRRENRICLPCEPQSTTSMASSLGALQLFSQIILDPYLIDSPKLRLKPIDMLFGIFDHIFKHVAGGEITDLGAMGDGLA